MVQFVAVEREPRAQLMDRPVLDGRRRGVVDELDHDAAPLEGGRPQTLDGSRSGCANDGRVDPDPLAARPVRRLVAPAGDDDVASELVRSAPDPGGDARVGRPGRSVRAPTRTAGTVSRSCCGSSAPWAALRSQHCFTSPAVACAPPQYTQAMAITQGSRPDVTEGVRAALCARVHSGETRSTHRSGTLGVMDLVTDPVLADVRITAADHPSLDAGVARFADEVKAEPRYFGRPGGPGPKPYPSLIARVCSRESGFRIAALHEGRVVGLARVDDHGEVFMVVVALPEGEVSDSRSHTRWSNVPETAVAPVSCCVRAGAAGPPSHSPSRWVSSSSTWVSAGSN